LNTDTGLLAFLRDDFPDFVRARGKDYYRRGKVRIERVRERRIEATVQGTEPYQVVVSWEDGHLHESAAPARAARAPSSGPASTYGRCMLDMEARGLGPTAEEVERAGAEREAFLAELAAAEPDPPEEQPAPEDDSTPPFGPLEPPRGWRERIERAGARAPPRGARPWPRAAGEMQLVYALDIEGSILAGVPLLWIGERRRKKDGTGAASDPWRAGARWGERCATRDLRILAALGGAENAEPYLTYGFQEFLQPGEPEVEPSSGYLLHATVARDLLPRIAATGRLGCRAASWATAPSPGTTASPSRSRSPSGRRPSPPSPASRSSRASCAAPASATSSRRRWVVFGVGFVVLPGRLARFDPRGGLDWGHRSAPARAAARAAGRGGRAARARAAHRRRGRSGLSLLPVEDAPRARAASAHRAARQERAPRRSPRGASRAASPSTTGARASTPSTPRSTSPTRMAAACCGARAPRRRPRCGRAPALGLRRTAGDERWHIHGTVAISRAAPLVRALLARAGRSRAEGKRWRSAGGVSLKVATGSSTGSTSTARWTSARGRGAGLPSSWRRRARGATR
jgi:hypothetical protein